MKPYPLVAYVPNPAHPRSLRPVAIITDRAKRYRANASPPAGPRRCNFCGARKNVDIDHVSGDEAEGHAGNLLYLCRTCNTKKGIVQKRANIGTRTRQFNPNKDWQRGYEAGLAGKSPRTPPGVDGVQFQSGVVEGKAARARKPAHQVYAEDRLRREKNGAPSYGGFLDAVFILRGDRPGDPELAAATIQATPPAKRIEYGDRIEAIRKQNPGAVPSYAQYAAAVAGHTRKAHDEGGKVIHATPKARRSEYARKIAATKRSRGTDRRASVPF
jgi:hypothetical protein